MLEKIILFNLSSNPDLTKKIAGHLKLPIGQVELMHFADGEIMARSLDSVRGKSVYIIQSTCSPASERLMELLVFIDGIKKPTPKISTSSFLITATPVKTASPGREPISARWSPIYRRRSAFLI